ncbi:MAG: hypothetical protein ACFFC3_04395 [Candidatus Odinarchaeota archaeon]
MKLKIDLSRQSNFILALLLIYFVFFGYICNVYVTYNFKGQVSSVKDISVKLLFLYQILFSPESILSLLILFLIVFIMALREDFFEYAIRNSIWLIPAILIMAWIWHWIIYGFDIFIISTFFSRWEGYVTILSLFGINLLSSISAVVIKQKYIQWMGKSEELITN